MFGIAGTQITGFVRKQTECVGIGDGFFLRKLFYKLVVGNYRFKLFRLFLLMLTGNGRHGSKYYPCIRTSSCDHVDKLAKLLGHFLTLNVCNAVRTQHYADIFGIKPRRFGKDRNVVDIGVDYGRWSYSRLCKDVFWRQELIVDQSYGN